jgi:hypothetical protein
MDLATFCRRIKGLQLTAPNTALSILWFHDEQKPDTVMTSGQLQKIMFEAGLGNPNSTQLGTQIKKSRKAISSKHGFRLKELSRHEIREWLEQILGSPPPNIEQDLGYLPRDVWKETRGYLEAVCVQLNGCYQCTFYDAASVMIRRVAETLIIECYEHLSREAEIKGSDGYYLMLKDLIGKVNGSPGLSLGRDAKKALTAIKELGDRSAHNRRFRATKPDLDKLQSGVRVAVDEMIALADLRRKS